MPLHSPKGYASKEILKSLEESKAIAKFRRQPCEESRKDFFLFNASLPNPYLGA